jgi:RNA polymerase sigma-70 factor (ECF subfamily)
MADHGKDEYEELFRKARPRLLIMARIAGIPAQDCEDVVQDALTAAHGELCRGRGPARSSFGTWLQGIEHYKIIDYWRKKKREDSRSQPSTALNSVGAEVSLIESLPARQPDPDLVLAVRQVVDSLPEKERYILLLNDTLELTIQQIAAKLGLPQTTAWRLLKKARLHFAERFMNSRRLK